MTIEAFDLILISLFAGIGNGMGTPIGKALYAKYLEKWVKHLNGGFDGNKNDRNRDED